jgi:hypothetical protein
VKHFSGATLRDTKQDFFKLISAKHMELLCSRCRVGLISCSPLSTTVLNSTKLILFVCLTSFPIFLSLCTSISLRFWPCRIPSHFTTDFRCHSVSVSLCVDPRVGLMTIFFKCVRSDLYGVIVRSRVAQCYSADLLAGWSGVRVRAGAGNFSLHHRVETDSEAHPASYPMGKAAGAWS